MWIRQLTLLSWEIPSLNPYLVAYVLLDKVLNPHSLVPQSGLKAVGPLVAYKSVFSLHSGEIDVPNFWCTQWLQPWKSQATQENISKFIWGGCGGVLVTNAAGVFIFIFNFIVGVIWVSRESLRLAVLEVVPDDSPATGVTQRLLPLPFSCLRLLSILFGTNDLHENPILGDTYSRCTIVGGDFPFLFIWLGCGWSSRCASYQLESCVLHNLMTFAMELWCCWFSWCDPMSLCHGVSSVRPSISFQNASWVEWAFLNRFWFKDCLR